MKSFINKLFLISILSFSVFGVFVSLNLEADVDGNTELHVAAKELNVEKVKSILVECKKELNADELKIFLDRRNIKDKGKTALHYLAELAIEAEGFFPLDYGDEVVDEENAYEEESHEEYPKLDDLKTILEIIKLLTENSADVFVWGYQERKCPIDCFRVNGVYNYDGSKEFEEIRDLLWANYSLRKIIPGYYCTIS